MPTINQLLQDWEPVDIKEWWDEQTTIQLYHNRHTGLHVLVHIIRCEICRTPLWLNFKKTDSGLLIEEHKLTERCSCDDAENNNYGHDKHCPLSPCICDVDNVDKIEEMTEAELAEWQYAHQEELDAEGGELVEAYWDDN